MEGKGGENSLSQEVLCVEQTGSKLSTVGRNSPPVGNTLGFPFDPESKIAHTLLHKASVGCVRPSASFPVSWSSLQLSPDNKNAVVLTLQGRKLTQLCDFPKVTDLGNGRCGMSLPERTPE